MTKIKDVSCKIDKAISNTKIFWISDFNNTHLIREIYHKNNNKDFDYKTIALFSFFRVRVTHYLK